MALHFWSRVTYIPWWHLKIWIVNCPEKSVLLFWELIFNLRQIQILEDQDGKDAQH